MYTTANVSVSTQRANPQRYLGISRHHGVVSIVVVGRAVNVQGTGAIALSYLLIVNVLSQDLLSVFEPVHLKRIRYC